MTPSQRSSVTVLRPIEHRPAGRGLADLLADLPEDLPTAAAAVAAAAAHETGTDLAVGVRQRGDWTILAGTSPIGPPDPDGRADGVVRAGPVALTWDPSVAVAPAVRRVLRQAAVWLALAVERDDVVVGAAEAAAETAVIRDVVARLLSVRDVDQVLLSIADRTLQQLDADICGVLLREGDQVRMRSCVGNRVVETARLRMRRGQGVAGLVFLTGEPAKVDSYLEDQTISQDFMFLAEQEQTQSALAVPLRLQGEFIGVLEVWRRRPSVFTDRDVRRMVTLADFATIAIDNARLHDTQAVAVAQMKVTRDALEQQVAVLARSSNLQHVLLRTVLDGVGLPAIARTVATELGCQVGIYGQDGALVAAHSEDGLLATLPTTIPARTPPGRITLRLADGGGEAPAWTQPVYADGDQFGCVCLLRGEQSAELMEVAAGQVAMACSLTLLRQRTASRARAEELEQVLWDLLQGPVEHRIAARTRARQLNVTLRGALRVLYGKLENLDELAAKNSWDTSQTDRVRREVLRTMRTVDESRGLSLASLRGDQIAGITANLDRAGVKDLVSGLTTAVRRELAGLRLTWGISRAHDDVVELPSALNEAKTALSAAHRLGGDNVFLYEELGIVRLLLCSGTDPDLQTFVDDVTGPLVAYDRDNDGSLVRTLRAFFDADCTQRLAAERLFIHHKTLRYRLAQIKQLTGLDLSRHEDRMRADFALRLLQLNRTGPDEP
ncbi:helix-turn-helix domain-containing protein [Actinophytocola sp.]|uniref:helix-turn-helix domain-containing protein n=1 Tax=Actinophytocola sp. TaxID=1872138 RepID=UPI002ED7B70A